MVIGIINSAVIVQVKCRKAIAVLFERKLGLREARLVSAIVAESEARAVELSINIIYKMKKSLIFNKSFGLCFSSLISLKLITLFDILCSFFMNLNK